MSDASDIVITVRHGALRGKKEETCRGDAFYSFKGIPYAKPPVGKLRFRAPQPPEPWDGILDATRHRDKCIQFDPLLFTEKCVGSEDCLYLNVYTLNEPTDTHKKVKPVMVWIHGGAFIIGSGHSDECGIDYLITEDVIIVTINYRLGIFGFLRVDDPDVEIPGNAGMKDMVLALKWVKENIEAFGGDPNNVTIFGISAGGASVHYLTLSPLAKGLFHRAIIQSGSALCMWAIVETDTKPLMKLAEILHMQNKDEKAVVQEIEKLSAEELIHAQMQMKFEFGDSPFFAPVVEKPSKEPAFLLSHPLKIIQSGNFNKVPMIIGYTSREGMLMAIRKEWFALSDYQHFVPFNLGLEKGSPKSIQVSERIGQFFYGGDKPSPENIDVAYTIFSDTFFVNGIYQSIKEFIKVSSENIFLYRFSFEGNTNFLKSLFKITSPGTCHGDDVLSLFRIEKLPIKVIPNSREDITIKRYSGLFTNFAKNGNPNPKEQSDLINVEWKPVQMNKFNFLEIGENLTVGVNPDWIRIKFWEDLLNI